MDIVLLTGYLKRLYAVRCSVEVMKGAAADCFFSLRVIVWTTKSPFLSADSMGRACCSFTTSAFLPSIFDNLAMKGGGLFASRFAAKVQYSWGTNALISSSRSTIIFMATDCTRPAERPRRTLSHSSGESLYPTSRSSTRRACWALTLFMSMMVGLLMALSRSEEHTSE